MRPVGAGGRGWKVAAGTAALVCTPLVVAGCGSPGPRAGSPVTGTTSLSRSATSATTELVSTTTTAAGGAGSTGTSTSAPTHPAVDATPTCFAMDLSVHLGATSVGLGSVEQIVSFQNMGTTTCALYGYPGLQLLGPGGQVIATEVHRGNSVSVPRVALTTVKLSAGAEASFAVGYATATGYGDDRCPTSTQVRVTPPNDANPVTVTWALQPYGGTTKDLECGEVTVSPVYAGRGAPRTPRR